MNLREICAAQRWPIRESDEGYFYLGLIAKGMRFSIRQPGEDGSHDVRVLKVDVREPQKENMIGTKPVGYRGKELQWTLEGKFRETATPVKDGPFT